VINTEAHPFPRFTLGPLFSTGWKRKSRDANGKILRDPPKEEEKPKIETRTVVQEVKTADQISE
jgi:hypothetical protein